MSFIKTSLNQILVYGEFPRLRRLLLTKTNIHPSLSCFTNYMNIILTHRSLGGRRPPSWKPSEIHFRLVHIIYPVIKWTLFSLYGRLRNPPPPPGLIKIVSLPNQVLSVLYGGPLSIMGDNYPCMVPICPA